MRTSLHRCASTIAVLAMWLSSPAAEPAALRVVGVLGNTAGLSQRPVPYAYYTGIAADRHGRLFLAGAAEGLVVCSQDGECLAVLPLPQGDGLTTRSLVARAGDRLFAIATDPGQSRSALYRVDAAPAAVADLKAELVTAGPGAWAISSTLDGQGRLIVGQSTADQRKYVVTAIEPATGTSVPLFTLDQPQGATRPWLHFVQLDPDGQLSIRHAGGVDWAGRYTLAGQRTGDVIEGQIVDGFRYHFGYSGGLRRMNLAGDRAAPGDCGSDAPEIRMPAQLAHVGERYFFVGRGGAVEARWNGTTFEYTRRIGAVHLQDLANAGDDLVGVAYTAGGNADVLHAIALPKTQPIGELLQVGQPFYRERVAAIVPAPEGLGIVYRDDKGRAMVGYAGRARHLEFELASPDVKAIGQAVVQGQDLLLADPESGTIWRRPLLDKQAPFAAWRRNLPGVLALATTPDALYVATATQVSRLSPDGATVGWTAPVAYRGIRRLAAAPDGVYVCDTAAHVVDQLDAATGALLARLGTVGTPGSDLTHLNGPYAVAADANSVYVADNGNGRVVVATAGLWRPEIPRLPREDNSPIVAAKIPVTPPGPGRLSVNVYDLQDRTVRQLACAQPAEQPVTWDGQDQYGRPAAPGRYRYHGIIAPKLSLRYVTSISQSGQPPYRTADGRGSWGGVWGDVMDVCPVTAAPDSDIVVLWAFEEGEGGLIRMSQDGEVRWKQHLDWWMKASQMCVASDGSSVYVGCASAMDAPAGQSDYGGEFRRPMLWRVDAATGAKRLYAPAQQGQPMFGEYRKGERVISDMACRDGRLYLTAPGDGAVFVVEAATGKPVATWKLDNASGVAFDAVGTAFVGSGAKLLELDADGKAKRTVADLGGEIWAVAALPAGGFAASVGVPRHQVVVLDAAGREVRAIGARGGRPKCGKMQPESLLNPVGVGVTGNGRVFVAEHAAPRRFTRWSADGRLEREFHGPYYYSGMFGVDEEQPEHVYGDTHGDLIRYTVDYATGKWAVDSYWLGVYNATDNSHEQGAAPPKWWPRIRHRDGRTFWCSGSGGIVELRPDSFRHVAAVWGGWVEKQPDGNYRPVLHTKKTGLKGTWSDLNGDGQAQADEWQVTDQPAYPLTGSGPQQGWGAYFAEDFSLYMHDWTDDESGGVWKLPVAEWRNGVPIYRWEQARHVALPRLGTGLAHGASAARTAFADAGAVYAFNGGYNAAGLPGVGHGHDWEFAQVTKYDEATGQPLWHAGGRAPGFAAAGQHYCPTGPSGVIGDYIFWTDENSLVHVWDVQHGLYVDSLLDDIMRGPEPSPYTVWVELFNTRVFRHRGNGKVYLMAASDAIHVYELLGTDQKLARVSGEFELTADGLRAAAAQAAARTVARERRLEIPRAAAPPALDGDPAEFARAPAAAMALKPTAQGTARLLYDDANLYVAFVVQDDSPWRNAGGDPTALFKTGDEVSLWLGPEREKRDAPGLGDVRVLFAPVAGRTVAVAYRPKVAAGAKPVVFRSPTGEVRMDQVEELTGVKTTAKVTGAGYCLEAAIPWAVLGGKPAGRFLLDLSINFSDPAGQRNVARLHWGRNGAALVYDLPSEARFEPGTWGVGSLRP